MRHHTIAVLNAGSSSLKFALYTVMANAELRRDYHGQIEGLGGVGHFQLNDGSGSLLIDEVLGTTDHTTALQRLLQWLEEQQERVTLLAVSHRVVHGGSVFAAPVVVSEAVMAQLQRLIPLAPLHQPHALQAIEQLRRLRPDLLQVACFDTAFHHTMPTVAQRYALPYEYFNSGVRGYGFHGLSYEHVARVLPDHLGVLPHDRVIVAHLGNGASLCALYKGNSVATTMGFTPLDGLVMGTRCGAVDPGVLLYLLRHGMGVDELDALLHHQSGLLGLSGISSDMRTLLASCDQHATDAIEQFCYRAAREIGSLAAALAGLDAIVFTGGMGEHAAAIRERICQQAQWLGVRLDAQANRSNSLCISTPDSVVSVWVIRADEERVMARHCHGFIVNV